MKKCTICGNGGLKELISFKDFPVFMGATNLSNEKQLFKDLKYGICPKCNNLQILELVDLNILYHDNHNTEVVGKIWESHNEKFANFIKKIKPEIVLEIGSPSATIYKKLENEDWLKVWYSIEPNPADVSKISNKFKLIKGFVDNSFSFEKYGIEKPNCFVMSHVFEHLYNPFEMLNILFDKLSEGDSIIISIPNMDYISKEKLMPPSGLHFEHSYFVNLENVEHLFENSGFKIESYELYENHSYFIRGVRQKLKNNIEVRVNLKETNLENINNFNEMIEKYQDIISLINKKIVTLNHEVYVYGSHFPAQFLKALNLDTSKIVGCLDQSKLKIGKKLYGTNWEVYSPNILKDKENVSVICYMGPYTDEIKETLLTINDKITFL